MTIEEWVTSYRDQAINKDRLKLVFDYLIEYHPDILHKHDSKKYFYDNPSLDGYDFALEYAVLYAFDIVERS